MFHLNPYTDTVPNGGSGSTPLRPERLDGVSSETIEACAAALKGFQKIVMKASSNLVDSTVWEKFYSSLCADIIEERSRFFGRDFVVSQSVYTAESRELIRLMIPDVKFVVLKISKEQQSVRLCQRFGMPESQGVHMERYCHGFDYGAGEDDKVVEVEGKSVEDVKEEVVGLLDEWEFIVEDS
jgi:hypothetical protein